MKAILSEYTVLVVAIVIVGVFFILLDTMLNGNSSNNLYNAFNSAFCWSDENLLQYIKYNGGDYYTLDVNSGILDASDRMYGIDNIVPDLSQPYFKVEPNKDYIIKPINDSTSTQKWTKASALQGVSAYYKDKYGNEHAISDITVLVTEYSPKMAASGENEYIIYDSSKVVVKDSDALDKWGYTVEGDSTNVKLPQIVYEDGKNYNVANFASNGLVVNNDIPRKYKVVYRVQYGSLKAQYTAIFINQTRNRNTTDLIYDEYNNYYGGD